MLEDSSTALIDSSIAVDSYINECFICYEELDGKNKIFKLPCCNKELHRSCLEKWHQQLDDACTCPHCMQILYYKNILTPPINEDDSFESFQKKCERFSYWCTLIMMVYMMIGGLLSMMFSNN